MLQSPTGPSGWMKVSQLEVLITRACEPSLHEPNYALHLEVAEYINQKRRTKAAMMIARLANHRNPHIAILSLALLDTLEFLNELVRRFPERPPPFPGPVMSRILELISGWKEGICTESRWKEDLGNIRDMHRLLTFKGYRFRDARGSNNAAVNATANLKTAEELEEEDRAAQSAKLQELIRRGTPRDLAAAQELMKSLAGANPDAKPDYRTQALTELNKLEQKVILLNEMLDNVDVQRGEKFVTGDAYDQVSSILITARPKLQKRSRISGYFLQINDQINTVLSRYEAFKKGDFTFASNPIPQELSNNATGTSLIDLDDAPSTTAAQSGSGINDLNDLFSQPMSQPQPQPQQWAMGGFSQQPPVQPQHPITSPTPTPTTARTDPIFNNNGLNFGRPTNSMSPPHSHSATPPASIILPGTPGPAAPAAAPNYFGNGGAAGKAPMGMGMSAASPHMGMGVGVAQPQAWMGPSQIFGAGSPPQQQQQQQQQAIGGYRPQQPLQPTVSAMPAAPTHTPAASQQSKDPFADLAGLF
ncbi:VHS domain-containing protein [Pholiota molesta]|nr:VHS domain-containing protein [Pholiota molesta]